MLSVEMQAPIANVMQVMPLIVAIQATATVISGSGTLREDMDVKNCVENVKKVDRLKDEIRLPKQQILHNNFFSNLLKQRFTS